MHYLGVGQGNFVFYVLGDAVFHMFCWAGLAPIACQEYMSWKGP